MRSCTRCGTLTASICRVCTPCIEKRTARTAAEQGLAFPLTDPVRLERIVRIVRTPIEMERAS